MLFAACNDDVEPQKQEGVTIYFISNGGSRVESITARAGSAITPPADPVREGYFFVGWYLTRRAAETLSGTPETLPKVMPSKSVTYYAGWTDEGAQVTLDVNGGTLDVTVITAAIGAKLTELMRQYVPVVEEGVQFAGWYMNGKLIDDSITLTSAGASLQARYKAYYVVNVYKQGLDGKDALDEKESINELLDVGTVRTYTYKTYDGYRRRSDTSNASRTVTVGMHAADNVIDVYYDRLNVMVRYLRGNENAVGEESSFATDFGGAFTLIDNPFTLERHRFAGWRIGSKIFEEGAALSEEDLTVTDGDRIDIIAVWDERFVDWGGGVDVVWRLGGVQDGVQLEREDLPVMSGTVNAQNVFSVSSEQGRTLRGRLIPDEGVFTWDLGLSRRAIRYVVDENGVGSGHPSDYANLENVLAAELHLGDEVIAGKYHFSAAQDAYVFESDDEQPRIIYFSVFQQGGMQYFFIREELENSALYTDENGVWEFVFHANGRADLFACGEAPYWLHRSLAGSGTYTKSGDAYTLDIDGEFDGKTVKTRTYGRGLVIYDARYSGNFAVEGGGTLRLDGYEGATYVDKNNLSEDGEFYVVDGEIIFFGAEGSRRFAMRGGGVAPMGDPEAYASYVSADGVESIVTNGHGMLRYVDSRGRAYYANYSDEAYDADGRALRFEAGEAAHTYLLREGVATAAGAELGVYAIGGAKLYLDGNGGAIYEESGVRYACAYALRTEEPYDYQLSGDMNFRFMLDGRAAMRFDEAKAGEFSDKFGSGRTLILDGYGRAILRGDGEDKVYEMSSDGDILILRAEGLPEERASLSKSGSANVFVLYDESRKLNINRYDFSWFDEDGTNVQASDFLVTDGFDGVEMDDGHERLSGEILEISDDGVYTARFGEDTLTFKVFDYIRADGGTQKVYALYSADSFATLTSQEGTLALDGYGRLAYTLTDEEPLHGYYSMWGGVITARGGDLDRILYFNFNISARTFTRCTDVVVDGGVVKRYIGEETDVTIAAGATIIAEGAFRGSNVRSVSANRLETIEDRAFEGCDMLESVRASAIVSIGARAFYGCSALSVVTGVSNALVSIGDSAFVGCDSLAEMPLQSIRSIGKEAFKDLDITITLGENLSGVTFADRAFAHGDGVKLTLVWTALNQSDLPFLEGEPFAFDGDEKDGFIILISNRDQLEHLYRSESAPYDWSRYAAHIAWSNATRLGVFYSVESLNGVEFDRIADVDGEVWNYYGEGASINFFRYDAGQQNRVVQASGAYDEEAGTLNIGELRKFVVEGTELMYTSSNEETLRLTVTSSDELIADFDGTQVSFEKADKTFVLGRYEYVITLYVDGTFSYTTNYIMHELSSYACSTDAQSSISLLQASEDGKQFSLSGNYLVATYNGAPVRLDFEEIDVAYNRMQGGNYTFFIRRGNAECFFVRIALDETAHTYTATVASKYAGKTYRITINQSGFDGEFVAYTAEGDENPTRLHIVINDADGRHEYDAELAPDKSFEIPYKSGRYSVSFDERAGTARITSA